MVQYISTKGDHDGFTMFNPKSIFCDKFGMPGAIYDSTYAYYGPNIFKKIEQYFPDAKRSIGKQMINGNNNFVTSEIIYVSEKAEAVIACLLYWDSNDYKDDDDEGETDTGSLALSNSMVDDDVKELRIKKNSKFQSKITIYCKNQDLKIEKFFSKKLTSKQRKIKEKPRQLNIITASNEGIYLTAFSTEKVEINIEDNYNDDFREVSNEIIKRLSTKKDNGIVLLHSEPGAGKTSYLRHLTQKITNKRLIYMPPDMTARLADPEFMAFLMGYPNSILIIEDAENALQRRDAGGNQAVSNLLNNSDGLLGDALKIQIVCTFNCDINRVDPALLRPGRLIAEYKFEKLTKNKTEALIKKLYGEDSPLANNVKPMTLAEIYNLNDKKFKSSVGSQSIGFKR